ncbi:helix-turn-helix domain-containing protein [Streptomyces sp. NPDC004779]
MCHERTRLTRNFTVLDNALLQHKGLDGVAIGVGAYIASLPEGTPVDIKTLSTELDLGRTTVAKALNALEAHGYLRRTVIRTPDGRVATHTVFCHRPAQNRAPGAEGPARRSRPTPPPDPDPDPPPPDPDPAPSPPDPDPAPSSPDPDPAPSPPGAEPTPPPTSRPAPPPRRPLPPVPRPGFPARELLRSALHVLIGLRETDPRLYCSEADAEHLTPGVAAWLERGASPETIRHALTTDLPTPLHHPAALLAHRLAAHLPPAPPLTAPPPTPGPARPHPLHYCEPCDICFRAPDSTPCPTCGNPDTSPALSPHRGQLPSRC